MSYFQWHGYRWHHYIYTDIERKYEILQLESSQNLLIYSASKFSTPDELKKVNIYEPSQWAC